jgi:general secretion pathway protein J
MKRTASRRPQRGFTLIEVVLALSVTALIMLGLVSALAAFGSSGSRVDAHLQRVDEMRLVSSFLRDVLGRTPRAYRYTDADRGQVGLFSGGDRRLDWVGVMPARHGVGGLYHMALALQPSGRDSADLVLSYAPFEGAREPESADLVSSRVLVAGVERFDIAYRVDELDAAWQPQWSGSEAPPDLVQLNIAADGRAWPPLVVRIRAADMATAGVRFVVGAED